MSSRQRILLTGASSGFGALTARALARAGHDVYAGMRDLAGRGALPGAELTGWAEREGLSVTVVELDVTDDASVDAAVAAVLARAGGIDVLVNNAGVAAAGLVETFSVAAAQRLFDVNVFGVLRLLRAVLPGMRARGGGLVVYVSSTDGREVMPFLGLYNATKFAVEALADAYRYETDPLGIDSVVVQPGTFPTTRILPNLLPADDPDRAQGYGPILCDLMMPEMTGMDLHRELLAVVPDQANRMIFLTGGAFTATALAFLTEPPREYIEKPFDAANLRAIVQRHLRGG